jgi:geranylgeranyl reductase family protein
MSTTADVVVVGAGPAGCAAAITLARAGHDVLLVDKATFPRDKCCGDGLTTGALRILEGLGLDPASVASWTPVDDVVVRSPSGHEVTFPLPRDQGTFAAVARRVDLDAALVDLARESGAKVLTGHACDGVRLEGDEVVLDVDGVGEVRTERVVAADGMWSPMRKALGAGDRGYLGEWHAFRQYFTNVGPRASSELIVWFEPDLLPGYAWSFPLAGGGANVGFGIQRGDAPTKVMKALWPELLARPHIRAFLGPDATPESPHKAWPIPAHVEAAALQAGRGRVLFVGDAATAADPMTGEGIGQALLSGELAAQAIIGAVDVGAAYERSIRRELVADARMANALIRVLSSPIGARGAVRVAGATEWTRRNFARWLFEDYPRALLVTPGRWRSHSLTGTGAWVTSDHG